MVSVKWFATLLAAGLMASACSTSTSGATASPVRLTSPAPSSNPADTKAVDLRVRLDLLLGEHVMVVAKQAAAAAAHNDEYTGYATLLNTNGNDLVAVISTALGNQAGVQFKQAWDMQNGYLVDYTIGIVTHNANKSTGAMSGLQNGFVPQFAQTIASLTQLPLSATTQLSMLRVNELKTVLDEELTRAYAKMYPDLHIANVDGSLVGDELATRISRLYADKYPGDPMGKGADARVSLNTLLQEHAYLATMATDAAVAARTADRAAAVTALGVNADALSKVFVGLLGPAAGAQFGHVWGARDTDLMNYAMSGDATSRQDLTDKFVTGFYALAPSAANTTRDQVLATLKVIDDQRTTALRQVAADDRAAASAMQPVADRID